MTYVNDEGKLVVSFAALQWLNIVTTSAQEQCSLRFWRAVVQKCGEHWWLSATDQHRIHAVKIRDVCDFEPMAIDTYAALTRRNARQEMIDVGPFSEMVHEDAPNVERYICADVTGGLPSNLKINLEYLTDACWLSVNHVPHPDGVEITATKEPVRTIYVNPGGDWVAIIRPMVGTTGVGGEE